MHAASSRHDAFQAIADPTRRRMLRLLIDKELPIRAIAQSFPISRTAVNKHLHVLADAGLVQRRRHGRETLYRTRPEPLADVQAWLSFFERYWGERLAALKDYVETEEGPDA